MSIGLDYSFLKFGLSPQFAKQCICVQAELEEELNQKEGPEIEDARTIIAEVDQLFQTAET